ncbi:ubiquitin-conjugating enzyme e2, putative [Eimeria tenella]|uniref:Ubiquitin-conjugating enzyme e2, putative n=1 Tax=Eimeria tenella TaxID=5802 RepID=U6KLV3_EIMTE|nr:ubiquitin-conjugating enzyme e2, putative [Eimeria tenella]CDJ38951.1 ubiquitin-conjugating enzyme e2, putative [Eimeria tenella]|eukprot:XP_013229706.1 ubiquitin-conjugating enzyme e2, putative [Eimeria tenella]
MASSPAAARLRREWRSLQSEPLPNIEAKPNGDDLLTWYFLIHDLPADTPFVGGFYLGKIVFPPTYPFAPPSILLLTPNGRFEVNTRLCLSFTDFHPELWNPSWKIETLLTGFVSFMLDEGATNALGSISTSREERRRLARESGAACMNSSTFRRLFPEFIPRIQAAQEATSAGARNTSAGPSAPGSAEASAVARPQLGSVPFLFSIVIACCAALAVVLKLCLNRV